MQHPELDLSTDVLRKEILHGEEFLARLKQLREAKIHLGHIARGPGVAQWVLTYRAHKRPVWKMEPKEVEAGYDSSVGF